MVARSHVHFPAGLAPVCGLTTAKQRGKGRAGRTTGASWASNDILGRPLLTGAVHRRPLTTVDQLAFARGKALPGRVSYQLQVAFSAQTQLSPRPQQVVGLTMLCCNFWEISGV